MCGYRIAKIPAHLPGEPGSPMVDHMRESLTNAAEKAEAAPDFRHVEAWIFDLDNTLYPAETDLFVQIDARMTEFVQELLDLEYEPARKIQKDYYRDHGTTLNGLMRVHGVDPEDFLSKVHDIDLSALKPDPRLSRALARLPGRRFVFTNGCRQHAERVLARLELDTHFDDIWDIRTTGFRPKPDESFYRAVMTDARISPARCAMFEDVARNLVPAHALGWTTVWLENGSVWSKQGPQYPVAEAHHIHYVTEDLAQFLHSIRI
jgi:putative hydrolase of the HAD superfamily